MEFVERKRKGKRMKSKYGMRKWEQEETMLLYESYNIFRTDCPFLRSNKYAFIYLFI